MRKVRNRWWGLGRSDFETFSWQTVLKIVVLGLALSAAISLYVYNQDQKAKEARRKVEQEQFEADYREKFRAPIYTNTPETKKVSE